MTRNQSPHHTCNCSAANNACHPWGTNVRCITCKSKGGKREQETKQAPAHLFQKLEPEGAMFKLSAVTSLSLPFLNDGLC